MNIYLFLIFVWILIFLFEFMYDDKIVADVKLITANLMGFALFLVMSLRHHSVGVDTGQYLFRYNHVIYPLNFDIFFT